MDQNYKIVRQAMLDHCRETGIRFNDFCDIWAAQINEYPSIFDSFFDIPFSEISETERDARVELLINIFTLRNSDRT